jgi:general secretion pathway protein H
MHRGFTLLELLVVLAIVAFASAGVGFALHDDAQTRLEREALRLSALLEAARAQAQVQGVAVRWRVTPEGFRFEPNLALVEQTEPRQWLDPDTRAQVEFKPQLGVSSAAMANGLEGILLLGPDAIIGPQTVLLYAASQPLNRLRLGTDGVRPFVVQADTP